MKENSEMILLTEALDIVEQKLSGIALPAEIVPVRNAVGRVIAEDQVARIDVPSFNKSAMDGYAIGAGDELEEYTIIETVPAGGVPKKKLSGGTAIKVMTGAPVPDGTAKVIMIEQTRMIDGKIRILSRTNEINICPKGQDVHSGEIVLRAPAILGALEIANLISVGITNVKVTRPVRVAILATGNEIVDIPEYIQPGKIMNSNSPMLECLSKKYLLEIASSRIVPDNRDATVSALRKALDSADIIVLSGGVSVGDYDYVAEAIDLAGMNLHFNRIAVKPGKPMTFASSNEKVVFGLPGNPVAVFLMFHIFVLYAARLLMGIKAGMRYVNLPLAGNFNRCNAERMAFLPCKLTKDGLLEQVEYHGTAHLHALLDCDGFFAVPKDVMEIKSGEKVSYLSIKDGFA